MDALRALRAEDGEKEAALQVMIDLLREQDILREQGCSGEARKKALAAVHKGALESAQQEFARLRDVVSHLQKPSMQQDNAQKQSPVAFGSLQKACAALVASFVGTAAYLIAPGDTNITLTGVFLPVYATHPAVLAVLLHTFLAAALIIVLCTDASGGRARGMGVLAIIETEEGGTLVSALRWQAAGISFILVAKAAALISSQGGGGLTTWDALAHFVALAIQGWGGKRFWSGQTGQRWAAALQAR